MSEDEYTPVGRPEGLPGQEASDSLARSLAARWGWAGAGLQVSPRRRPPAAPEVTPGGAYARLALSGAHTSFFLRRMQSKTDRATVWRPDLGGLEPALVERFSEAIVGRQPELEIKYERRPLRGPASEVPDLTLAGRVAATESGQEPAAREGFRPFASLGEFRRALQGRESPAGPTPAQAGPAAAPAPRPGPARQAAPVSSSIRRRALSPGERPLSRVEEVPAGRPGGAEPAVTAAAPRAEEGSTVARETGAEEPDDAGPQPAPSVPPREGEAVPPPPAGSDEPPSQALQRTPGSDRVGGGDLAQQDGPPARVRAREDLPPAPPGPEVAESLVQRPPREPVSPPSVPAVEAELPEEALPPAQGTGVEEAGGRMSRQAPEVAGSGVEPGPAAEVTPRAQLQGTRPAAVQRQAGQPSSLQATSDSLQPSQVGNEAGEKAPAAEVSSAEEVRLSPGQETTLPLAPPQRTPRREGMPPAGMPPAEMAPAPETGLSGGARSSAGGVTATPRAPTPSEAGTEAEPATAPPAASPLPVVASDQTQPPAPAEAPAVDEAAPAPAAGIGAAMERPLSADLQGDEPARRLEETLVLPQLRRLARVARGEAEAGAGLGPLEPYVPPGPLAAAALPPAAGRSERQGEGVESAGPGSLAQAPTVAPGTIQRSPAPGREPVGPLPLPSPSLGGQGGDADLVQRAVTEPEEAGEGPNLDRLARDVLPLIKRMLAVERERRTGRWR